MIYEQTNLLEFITDNMAEYKAWLIAQYAAQSITVTIPALQYTGIYDTTIVTGKQIGRAHV